VAHFQNNIQFNVRHFQQITSKPIGQTILDDRRSDFTFDIMELAALRQDTQARRELFDCLTTVLV
jgi:hypothetical protein